MRRRVIVLACLALGVTSAACSAILGLDAPPAGDAGGPSTGDATTSDSPGESGDASDSGASQDGPPQPTTCASLDAGDGSVAYYPFDQIPVDDAGDMTWELFDPSQVSGFNVQPYYAGGAFDGRFVYFVGTGHYVLRYDTTGGGFADPTAWTGTNVSALAAFAGAVFDGRYVTLVPAVRGGVTTAIAVRYDTHAQSDFSSSTSAAWEYFDLSTLATDGGAPTFGFYGGVFDGRFIYFVPHSDGAPFGTVVRYDTAGSVDAGLPGEAGTPDGGDGGVADAGASAAGFANPALWSSFDVSTTNPAAKGFAGGVFADGAVYLVPAYNDAFEGGVNSGGSSIVARYSANAGFGSLGSWTTFDTTRVNGLAENDYGGAFDGRHVYFVPHSTGVVSRYDTASPFGSPSAWGAYDTTRTLVLEGGATPELVGAAFDGRFVYLVPDVSGVAPVLRYDTLSPFTSECAWSSYDPSQLGAPDGGRFGPYIGAVFDGQYLYLVPSGPTGTLFVRFLAKTPPSMPNLPAFNGSFL